MGVLRAALTALACAASSSALPNGSVLSKQSSCIHHQGPAAAPGAISAASTTLVLPLVGTARAASLQLVGGSSAPAGEGRRALRRSCGVGAGGRLLWGQRRHQRDASARSTGQGGQGRGRGRAGWG